jgi:hypothetical protein
MGILILVGSLIGLGVDWLILKIIFGAMLLFLVVFIIRMIYHGIANFIKDWRK